MYKFPAIKTLISFLVITYTVFSTFTVEAADKNQLQVLFDIACNLEGRTESERELAIDEVAAKCSARSGWLLKELDSEKSIRGQIAAKILGKTGDKAVEPYLLKAINSEDIFVSANARRALAELYTNFSDEELAGKIKTAPKGSWERNAAMFAVFKKGRKAGQLGAESERALVRASVTATPEELLPILTALRYAKSQKSVLALLEIAERVERIDVLVELLKALQNIKPQGESKILEQLAACGTPEVEMEALVVLHHMGYAKVPSALELLAGHSKPEIRARAITLLAECGGFTNADIIVNALDDNEPSVRLAAVKALGELKAVQAAAPLRAMCGPGGDSDPTVRAQAAVAFSKTGQAGALSPLLQDIKKNTESNIDFRVEAIRALGDLKNPSSLRVLLDVLEEPPTFAIEAARSLGKLGDKRALDALVIASKRNDKRLQLAAREAIIQINLGKAK